MIVIHYIILWMIYYTVCYCIVVYMFVALCYILVFGTTVCIDKFLIQRCGTILMNL
jgi:hypothetical protein